MKSAKLREGSALTRIYYNRSEATLNFAFSTLHFAFKKAYEFGLNS